MKTILLFLVKIIAKCHDKIMLLNDRFGWSISDKWLHFIVIGIFGFCLLAIIQPLFKWLEKRGATLLISFIYVFTVIIVVTFAIEIGQYITGTGDMDFYDIASGIAGFFVFFGIYLVSYFVYKRFIKENSNKNEKNN